MFIVFLLLCLLAWWIMGPMILIMPLVAIVVGFIYLLCRYSSTPAPTSKPSSEEYLDAHSLLDSLDDDEVDKEGVCEALYQIEDLDQDELLDLMDELDEESDDDWQY